MKVLTSSISAQVPAKILRNLELPAVGQIGFVVRDSAG